MIHYLGFIGRSRPIPVLHRLRLSDLQTVGSQIRIMVMIGLPGVMA